MEKLFLEINNDLGQNREFRFRSVSAISSAIP